MYLGQVLAKDESVQLAGLVSIYYGMGQSSIIGSRAKILSDVWRAIPLRMVGRHVCYDHKGQLALLQIAGTMMHPFDAVRTRVHCGSNTECLFNLMTYGIPRHVIPILDDNVGTIDLSFHAVLLETLIMQEQTKKNAGQVAQQPQQQQDGGAIASSTTNRRDELEPYDAQLDRDSWNIMEGGIPLPPELLLSLENSCITNNNDSINPIPATVQSLYHGLERESMKPRATNADHISKGTNLAGHVSNNNDANNNFMILVPGPEDVIMGRGRHNKNNPGNRKLNQMLLEYHQQYEEADKFQKTLIAEQVLKTMMETGSRFLIRESSSVVDEEGQGTDGDGSKKSGKGTTTMKKGMWIQVTPERVRDKIAHDFRNLRRPGLKKSEKTDDDANTDNSKRALTRNEAGPGNSLLQSLQAPAPKEQRRSSSLNPFAGLFSSE